MIIKEKDASSGKSARKKRSKLASCAAKEQSEEDNMQPGEARTKKEVHLVDFAGPVSLRKGKNSLYQWQISEQLSKSASRPKRAQRMFAERLLRSKHQNCLASSRLMRASGEEVSQLAIGESFRSKQITLIHLFILIMIALTRGKWSGKKCLLFRLIDFLQLSDSFPTFCPPSAQ